MKDNDKISEVTFTFRDGDHDITGVVVNPGGWFGKVYLVQIAIANALNPFYAVEADTMGDAIDEFADSRFSHLIDVSEEDQPETDEDAEENGYSTAGNDGHYVDLSNVRVEKAPMSLRYTITWNPLQDGVSAVIDQELDIVRDEIADA